MSDTTDVALVTVKANVNLDDVVSVRVAEVDLKLEAKISEQKELVTKAKEVMQAAQKAVEPSVKADGTAALKALAAKLDPVLKSLGLKVRTMMRGEPTVKDSEKRLINYTFGLSLKDTSCYPIEEITIPAVKARVAIEDLEKATKDFKMKNADLLKLLDAKSKMSTFERSCRAKVAETRLSQTDEGREILAQLRGEDANRVLALPSGTV